MSYEDVSIPVEGLEGQIPEPSPQQQSIEPSQQQPSQPQEPQWDGKQFPLKYRGNPYITKSRDEFINLANKGFSYSQELEKFNRDRAAWEQERNQLQSRYSQYDEFDKMLRESPDLASRMIAMFEDHKNGIKTQQPDGRTFDPRFNDVMSRMDMIERMNTERLNSEADRQLSIDLEKLREKYPNHDWTTDTGNGNLEQQLIQFAVDNGFTNLEHAYRVMMWDSVSSNSKAQALKGAANARQAATKAGVVSNTVSQGGSQQKQGYRYGDSYNDLAARAVEELKNMS